MNKKFTTFLASAMLVSAFSVGTVAAYVGTPVAPQATMAAEETPDPNATITPKKGEAVLFQNGSEAKFLGITKGTTFGYITKETDFSVYIGELKQGYLDSFGEEDRFRSNGLFFCEQEYRLDFRCRSFFGGRGCYARRR